MPGDIIAIVLGIFCFAVLYALLEGIDRDMTDARGSSSRTWARPTSSGSSSRCLICGYLLYALLRGERF